MGAVLHRTTLVYRKSVNTPNYDPADYVINPDISALGSVASKHWFIEIDDTIREMTIAEKATNYLAGNKTQRRAEVDARTQELIAAGFTHSTKVFSLSLAAQLNWTNAGLNAGALTYPYNVPTKDDMDFHAFADAAEMQTAYGTALGIKSGHLSTGADLKQDINDAVDQVALDAVVDTR